MSLEIIQNTLKRGVDYLVENNKVDTSTQTSLYNFITGLTDTTYYAIPYTSYNQTASGSGLSFNTGSQTVSNTSGSTQALITNPITIGNVVLKAIKVYESILLNYYWSTDGITWYNTDYFDIEDISCTAGGSLYYKFDVPNNVTVTDVILLYSGGYDE